MLTLAVPIFNKAQYLPRCIDALLAQTVRDYEILLIDDGSTDAGPAICDRYAAAHPERIRVIHQPNGGLSSARNAAIEAARGDFITFPDPDDWVEPDYVEAFLDLLVREPTDLVCTGFWVEEGDRRYPGYHSTDTVIMTGAEGRKALLLPPQMGGFSWNKCYRLELLHHHGLRFRSDVGAAEDLDFAYRYLRHCGRVCFCPSRRTCHYVQYPDSVTHSFSRRNLADFQTYDMIAADEDRDLAQAARDAACLVAMRHLWLLQYRGPADKKAKRTLLRHIRRNLPVHLRSPRYGLLRKLQTATAAVCPSLFVLLKRTARRLR